MDTFIGGKAVSSGPLPPAATTAVSPLKTLGEDDADFLTLFPYRKFFGDLDEGDSKSYAKEVLRFIDPSGNTPKEDVLLKLQRLSQQVGVAHDVPKVRLEKIWSYVKAANSVHSIIMEVSSGSSQGD